MAKLERDRKDEVGRRNKKKGEQNQGKVSLRNTRIEYLSDETGELHLILKL